MTISLRASARLFIALMLVSVATQAQQAPLTGQMLAPVAPAGAVADSTPPAAAQPAPPMAASDNTHAGSQVGDSTHQLLNMQAQGTHAGKHLPIPGQQASASYQRYLKSFEHPIPEFYDAAVSKNTGASSTSDSP